MTKFKPVFLSLVDGRVSYLPQEEYAITPSPQTELKMTTTRRWKDGQVVESKREYSAG